MLALMPFLNNNNSFSNTTVTAQYDKYGDSHYSIYQTGDKKYESRTGLFEGFFNSVDLMHYHEYSCEIPKFLISL
jgi:hypothetical protein